MWIPSVGNPSANSADFVLASRADSVHFLTDRSTAKPGEYLPMILIGYHPDGYAREVLARQHPFFALWCGHCGERILFGTGSPKWYALACPCCGWVRIPGEKERATLIASVRFPSIQPPPAPENVRLH